LGEFPQHGGARMKIRHKTAYSQQIIVIQTTEMQAAALEMETVCRQKDVLIVE
jgi:hypothetical protein